jgi:hypothetical protein
MSRIFILVRTDPFAWGVRAVEEWRQDQSCFKEEITGTKAPMPKYVSRISLPVRVDPVVR